MLKLKLQYSSCQYSSHLMQRAASLEKTLMLGKIEGKSRRGQQKMKWLDSNTKSMHMNLSKLWEIVEDKEAWHAVVHGITESELNTTTKKNVETNIQTKTLNSSTKETALSSLIEVVPLNEESRKPLKLAK